MQFLKADTTTTVRIGPAVDISDGYTCLATLDISTADYAYISEHGGTETDISGNTWAAVASVTGWYDLTLTAAQLDTEGPLTVMIYDVSLCLPIFKEFMVVNANVYDSLFAAAATDYLKADLTEVLDETPMIITGTVDGTGSATVHQCNLDSDGYTTNDALNGRVIIFEGNTTAALKGQAATITDYDGTTGYVTVGASAITSASASGDKFTIV
jgi:hypothetical protein